ncbi:MAG: hypothetical protein CMJ83_06720, partial [Planctomycetes bacterium]|nr:hypothetical protein [Planctomycetota bacterium]
MTRTLVLSILLALGSNAGAQTPTRDQLASELADQRAQREALLVELSTTRTRLDQLRADSAARRQQLRDTEKRTAMLEARLKEVQAAEARNKVATQEDRIKALEADLTSLHERFHESYPGIRVARANLDREKQVLADLVDVVNKRVLHAEVQSYIQDTVDGRAQAAQADLAAAIAIADENQRPRLMVQQAVLLERKNDLAAAREVLQELRRQPAPYAEWAAERLTHLIRREDEVQMQATDTLLAVVSRLDGPANSRAVMEARRALDELGALAVPTVTVAMDTLGPWGRRHALAFLAGHANDGVASLIGRMLATPDETMQLAAAEVLAGLPAEHRVPLAETALRATFPGVRLQAARALAQDASRREHALALITELVGSGGIELRRLAVAILTEPAFATHAAAAEQLARLIRDPDPDVWARALDSWASRTPGPSGDEVAALLASLTDPVRRSRCVILCLEANVRDQERWLAVALSHPLTPAVRKSVLIAIDDRSLVGCRAAVIAA